jgi:hypothetical protein
MSYAIDPRTVCAKCGNDSGVLVNGRCCNCKPFSVCPKCKTGTLVGSPTPNWMNRTVCDNCGHKKSR